MGSANGCANQQITVATVIPTDLRNMPDKRPSKAHEKAAQKPKSVFTVQRATDTPAGCQHKLAPTQSQSKIRQIVAVDAEARHNHQQWVKRHDKARQMAREFHRIARLALLSEALRYQKAQRAAGNPHRLFTKFFVEGLVHDINMLLHPSQPKDFSKTTVDCISELCLFHDAPFKHSPKMEGEDEWYTSSKGKTSA